MKKVKESLIFLPCIYFKDNLILILIKIVYKSNNSKFII